MTCTLNLPQGENSLWEPWAVSKGNNAEFWKENLQTIAFLPSRPSHFFFFPLQCYLLTSYPPHPACSPCRTKGLSAPACLPSPQFPELSVDIFTWACITGWRAKRLEAAARWLFLQDGALCFCWWISAKPSYGIPTFQMSPPSQPQILFVLCSQRGFYCWVFLCVFCFPGAEAGSNTWCGRHSPLKICRFSPTNASVNLCGVTACGHLVLLLERALRLTLSQR